MTTTNRTQAAANPKRAASPPPHQRRPNRTALATLVIAIAIAIVLVVVVGAMWLLLGRFAHRSENPVIPPDHCLALASEYRGSMLPEQSANAAIVVGESIRRGLPARAATIALVTVWQESSVLNLNYGDRDSLGLFQQRPSQGWGTPDQIMDPWYASGKFYDALVKVKDWQTRPVGEVAQAVQRSAYPDAYDQYEANGRAWASALTGQTVAGLRCVVNDGTGGGGDELVALLNQIWGNKLTISQTGQIVQVTTPNQTAAWAVAQISMAQLASYGMTSVQVGDQIWQPQKTNVGTWQQIDSSPTPSVTLSPGETPTPPPPAAVSNRQVVITLR